MSETNTPGGEQAPPAADYVPQHVLSSDDPDGAGGPPDGEAKGEGEGNAKGDGEGEGDPAPAEQAGKPEKTEAEKREAAENKRIATLTRQRYAEKARADAAEAARADLEARLSRLENPNGQPTRDFDTEVQKAAAKMLEDQQVSQRVQTFHEAGEEAFGAPGWAQRCKDLMAMGADAQLASIFVELPNGAAVAGALAENPRELSRIAELKTERARAIELTNFAAGLAQRTAAGPSAVSGAPAPIRPPAIGRARGEPDPNGSNADYERWSKGVNWANR